VSLRETLNKNPSLTIGVTAALLAIAAVVIITQLWPEPREVEVRGTEYFTADDGKAWQELPLDTIAPYTDPEGKVWVLARLFECPNGHLFVGYLERYTNEAAQKLRDAGNKLDGTLLTMMSAEVEIKRPGDRQWVHVRKEYEAADRIRQNVKCPEHGGAAEGPLSPDLVKIRQQQKAGGK